MPSSRGSVRRPFVQDRRMLEQEQRVGDLAAPPRRRELLLKRGRLSVGDQPEAA